MMRIVLLPVVCLCAVVAVSGQDAVPSSGTAAAQTPDPLRSIQVKAIEEQKSDVVHWGPEPGRYSSWIDHSNRLVPVYTFGITLDALRAEGSVYSDPVRLKKLYGRVPDNTVNPTAMYYDQTDIYRLQLAAIDAGFSNIILMVFDGMDWQTTRAAALYRSGRNAYETGRGSGLSILDYRRTYTDYGFLVTSPLLSGAKIDVNAQTAMSDGVESTGGYDPILGGEFPWREPPNNDYVIGQSRDVPHTVTDSGAAATSMVSGIKTYNGAINVKPDGSHVTPIARTLQFEEEFRVGIVTNVAVSHATPAAAYANNVTRKDFQDISRDLLGLPSSSHRDEPLPGVDVLIGAGWGENQEKDATQGDNYRSGNRYLHQDDIDRVNVKSGGEYVVVQRANGKDGGRRLMSAAQRAADEDYRLLAYFGAKGGHLPYRTADGRFNPSVDMKGGEKYSEADVKENPSLAQMTRAALLVLEQAIEGFWLMIEVGDVDWANHANNIDCSVGAVLSGDEAFEVVMDWIDENNAWSYTAVIITADHGHYLVIDDPAKIIEAGKNAQRNRR